MRILRLFAAVLIGLVAVNAQARQPIFFSLYGGGTTFDADYEFALPLDLDLDDDGNTIGLGVGYEVTDRWLVQLDYTYTDADQVTVDQILLSLNYKFPIRQIERLHGVVGIIVGEGKLDLEDAPDFTDARFDDLDAAQSAIGFQAGLIYDLSDSWSTSLRYQYLDQEFKTYIETNDTIGGRLNFFHESFQYVLFGMSYHF